MTYSQPPSLTKGVSGSTLKIIAVITMFIDHVGAILLPDYMVLRLIGRIAFPIFCFLLTEGFLHTRNVKNYALRLGLFALLSEIPFDLAFHNQIFDFGYQNVFFTLFIGLLAIIGLHTANKRLAEKKLLLILTNFVIILAGMLLAYLLKTDYSYMGVLIIILIYENELHFNKAAAIFSACVGLTCMTTLELTSFISVPLIYFYNGKRGLSLKYFFYAFYPVHLLLLYLIYRIMFI